MHGDPWFMIKGAVDGFNDVENRKEKIAASHMKTMDEDEMMSAF